MLCYAACVSPKLYADLVRTSLHGHTCQAWSSQIPYNHQLNSATNIDSNFPEGTVAAAQNYCRDPDNTGIPWCYTPTGMPAYVYDTCAVRFCGQ